MTASNDPAAIERTSTASGSRASKPGIASPAGRSVSKAIAASGAVTTTAPRRRSLRKPLGARIGIVADDEDAGYHGTFDSVGVASRSVRI